MAPLEHPSPQAELAFPDPRLLFLFHLGTISKLTDPAKKLRFQIITVTSRRLQPSDLLVVLTGWPLRGRVQSGFIDTHRATAYHGAMKTALLCGPIVPAYGPVPSDLYVWVSAQARRNTIKAFRSSAARARLSASGSTTPNWTWTTSAAGTCALTTNRTTRSRWAGRLSVIVLQLRRTSVRSQPNVIVAVGVYAMRWCLRASFDLSTVHGRKFEVQIGDHKAVCVRSIILPPTGGLSERRWGRPTSSPWRGCCGPDCLTRMTRRT